MRVMVVLPGPNLRAETSLVELLFLVKELPFFFFSELFMHPFVLPFVKATRKRAGSTAHGAGGGQLGGENWFRATAKDVMEKHGSALY